MKDFLDFTGKVAVVTGGRRGLGAAASLAFAERGALVVIVARNDNCDDLLKQIEDAGGKALYIKCDLASKSDRAGLIGRIIEKTGHIDILVNNAGIQYQDSILECTDEQWYTSESILLDAPFELCRDVVPHMVERGGGKIINISSICAVREGGGNFSYACMKAALMSMTRAMANGVAMKNINVNAIAPGIIRTDLTRSCYENENLYRWLTERYPARRFGYPEEIASVVLFLASEMASFVNGQMIPVDGGFTGN